MKSKTTHSKKIALIRALLASFALLTQGTAISCANGNNVEWITPVAELKLSETSPTTEIIISWNACVGCEGYVVTRTYVRDGETIKWHWSVSKDELSFTNTDCEPDTEYTYTVSAGYLLPIGGIFFSRLFNQTTEKYSEPVSIKTAKDENVTLDYPHNLKFSELAETTNALRFSWDPVDGADYYKIYDEYKDTEIYTVTETEFILRNVFNENYYAWRVKAFTNDGKSSVFSVTEGGRVPEAKNTNIKAALKVENGTLHNFYSYDDLYFLIEPKEGIIQIHDCPDFMIFSEDGKLLNGNPFTYKDPKKNYITYHNISGFSAGTKYIIRFCTQGRLTFCVE